MSHNIYNILEAIAGAVLTNTFHSSQCTCTGFNLTYECIIMSDINSTGGATVWTGTAFDCPATENQLTFLHIRDRFIDAYRGCNGGAITGHGLRIEENRYTSQVNIIVDRHMDRRSVECFYQKNDNKQGLSLVDNFSIMITSGIIHTLTMHNNDHL